MASPPACECMHVDAARTRAIRKQRRIWPRGRVRGVVSARTSGGADSRTGIPDRANGSSDRHMPGILAGLALLQYQPVGNLECLRGGDRKIEMCLLVEILRVPEADMSKRKVLLGLIG